MTRRCSHCSHNGHNTRTCPTRGGGALASSASSSSLSGAGSPSASGGVKLFGVRLTDGSFIKKSASMGNLSSAFHHHHHHHHSSNPDSPSSDHFKDPAQDGGYLSDDPNDHVVCSSSTGPRRAGERKKGVPWTEEEHRLFLVGLQKLGKGDWRGIARNFVVSRTPTQVASHAQKHFIRQSNVSRRKRRSSLFDMVPDMVKDPQPVEEEHEKQSSQARETDIGDAIPSLDLSLKSEYEPMETASPEPVAEPDKSDMGSNEPKENFAGSNEFMPIIQTTSEYPSFIPGFFPAYVPVPYSFWPANSLPHQEALVPETYQHQVLRPVPVLPKEPVNVDELVGITHLSLGESERSQREPSPLSLKLVGEPSRQSAFHANDPVNTPELSKDKGSPIQAV